MVDLEPDRKSRERGQEERRENTSPLPIVRGENFIARLTALIIYRGIEERIDITE